MSRRNKSPRRSHQGLSGMAALSAVRLESLIHGAALPDLARTVRPQSDAAIEASELMARADAQARTPPMEQLPLTTSDQPTEKAMITAAKPARNYIGKTDFLKLTRWIETQDVKTFKSVRALTDAAEQALTLTLSVSHTLSVLDALDITYFKRQPKPESEITALELARATANAVAELIALAGAKPSPAFTQALARAGLSARSGASA